MRLSRLVACIAIVAHPALTAAQGVPPRAVRRDIPMTNAIRRAFAGGTRDSTGRPGRNYWQLKTDYTIAVRLDAPTSRLYGTETIALVNNSPDTLRQVALRLPMNHFLFNVPRAATWVPSEETDGMLVTKLAVNGSTVALTAPANTGGRGGPPASFTAPYLQGGKTTIARIMLTQPILPHASASIAIEWNHKLPGGDGGSGHRMTQRWADTLYQPTQWFPRVAVYDDMRGWDSELYLGPSEFYNDFGRFDVKITVPGGWIVSGTGVLQNPAEVLTAKARAQLAKVTASDEVTTIVGADEAGAGVATAAGDQLTWHMVAENVNDFAWATARKYVWQATRATIPGKGTVPVHMVYLPGHASLYADAGPIARHALEFYSKLWFPYSFPQLTLQDGPSAGMEYPMVINSNRGAADHETGHQWWPMTVSNNETWYGWMDEGFNQYMNILSGADSRRSAPNLNGLGQSYGRTSGNEAEPPMMWNANYAGPGFYGFTTYNKMPLLLSMLGGIVGDTAVQRAQSAWGTTWSWKHPSPWDWMFFMNDALKARAGGDLRFMCDHHDRDARAVEALENAHDLVGGGGAAASKTMSIRPDIIGVDSTGTGFVVYETTGGFRLMSATEYQLLPTGDSGLGAVLLGSTTNLSPVVTFADITGLQAGQSILAAANGILVNATTSSPNTTLNQMTFSSNATSTAIGRFNLSVGSTMNVATAGVSTVQQATTVNSLTLNSGGGLVFEGGNLGTTNSAQGQAFGIAGALNTLTITSGGVVANSGNTGILAGSMTSGTAPLYFQVLGSGTTLNANTQVLGSGGLVKSGAGTLVLGGTGRQSFNTGGTWVNAGTLRLGANNALLVGLGAAAPTVYDLNLNGGALDVNGMSQAVRQITQTTQTGTFYGAGTGNITNSSATTRSEEHTSELQSH